MDGENETNVAAAPSSQEPAKTAATEHVDELAGTSAGTPIATAQETNVAPAPEPAAAPEPPSGISRLVREIVTDFLLDHDRQAMVKVTELVQGVKSEAVAYIDSAIETAKADILKHLAGLVAPIVAASAAAAAAPANTPAIVGPHELAVGDPVQVWVDKKANTFRLGKIAAIHDGAHAFDVELDDGTVTKVPADGLQFDDK